MPYSLVLHCVSSHGTLHPEDRQGQKAMALFLEELIQMQDATVAARLHAAKNAKPYTTAILPRPGMPSDRHRSQSAGEASEVHIRLTLLDDALYPLVSQFFLQN